MRMGRTAVVSLTMVMCWSCSGGKPTGPGNGAGTVVSIAVTSATTSSVFIQSTITLSATALDASGAVLTGQTFSWASSNNLVATVSPSGVVTGIAAGIATISATIGSIAGQTAVSVAPTAGQLSCASSTPLALNVGDVHMLSGVERSSLCLAGGAGSEYVLIALNATLDTASTATPFTLTATNSAAVANAPSPRLVPSRAGQPASMAVRNRAFEMRLREEERRELGPRLAAARAFRTNRPGSFNARGISALTGVPSSPPIGTLIQLNGNALSACSSPQLHEARVVAVSQYAIVAVDTLVPANGFTGADYQNFAATFDTLIYPLDTLNFGVPSDIDGNGKVLLFFSQLVNQLSAPGSGSYIGGFFYARDLFPPGGTSKFAACAGSNNGEMFYLPVVDSAQLYNTYFHNKAVLSSQIFTTITHEFQHLINAGRHMWVNTSAADFEEIWLDEDLSLIAQELLYYRVSGFGPRQRLTHAVVTSGGNANGTQLSLYTAYATEQLSSLDVYLQHPESNSPYANDDQVPTAGAGWAWLRYVLDNTSGSQAAFTRALDNGLVVGFANLSGVFAAAFPNIGASFQQWAVAQYLDGTGVSSDPLYAFQSWNYRDVIGNLTVSGRYSLATHALLPSAPVSLSLRPGAAGYLRFRVNAGLTAQVRPANDVAASTVVTFAVVRTF